MQLKEYLGYELFHSYGIKTPRYELVTSAAQATKVKLPGKEFFVKAQVAVGSRKKAGAVVKCAKEGLGRTISSLLGKEFRGKVAKEALVEEKITFSQEHYISLTIDSIGKTPVLLFSDEGGIDVEELDAGKIRRLPLDRFDRAKTKKFFSKTKHASELITLVKKMLLLMKEKDCELVEINPLVFVKGKPVALDSKVIIDDNSLFRHEEYKFLREEEFEELEKYAHEKGVSFVQLDGDIGVIGNGAGLVMATLDVLAYYGGKPENFLDLGGGTGTETMLSALDIITREKPRKLLINIFGGITRCDEIARAIVQFKKDRGLEIPFVVRLIGTNELQALEILEGAGIHSMKSMENAAKKVVEL